jgi:hypothetical protein
MKSRLRTVAGALSGQTLGPRAAVLVLGHEQPVPIFQQLARSHPSGRDDVRQIPACHKTSIRFDQADFGAHLRLALRRALARTISLIKTDTVAAQRRGSVGRARYRH